MDTEEDKLGKIKGKMKREANEERLMMREIRTERENIKKGKKNIREKSGRQMMIDG